MAERACSAGGTPAAQFLAVLVPLAVLTLVLPAFTTSTELPEFTTPQALFFAALTIMLYGVFLVIQTLRHRNQFMQSGVELEPAHPDPLAHDETAHEHGHNEIISVPYHAVLLVLTILPVVLLSKKLAAFVDYGSEAMGRRRRLAA